MKARAARELAGLVLLWGSGCPGPRPPLAEPEACWDSVDNDLNGQLDCDDPVCEARFDCQGRFVGAREALLDGQTWAAANSIVTSREWAVGELDGHLGPDFVLGSVVGGEGRETWFGLSSRRGGEPLEAEAVALPLSSGRSEVEIDCDVDGDGEVDILLGEYRLEPPAVVRHVRASDLLSGEWTGRWEVSELLSNASASCLGRPDDLERPRLFFGLGDVRLVGALDDDEFPFAPTDHGLVPPPGFGLPSPSQHAFDWNSDGFEDLLFPAMGEEEAGASWTLGMVLPGGTHLAEPLPGTQRNITEEEPPAFPITIGGIPGPAGECCEVSILDVTSNAMPDLVWRVPAERPESDLPAWAAAWADGSQLASLDANEPVTGDVYLELSSDPVHHGTVSMRVHDAADFDANGTLDLLVSGFISVSATVLPELPQDTSFLPYYGAFVVGVFFDVDGWEPRAREPLSSLGAAVVTTHWSGAYEHVGFTDDVDGGGVQDIVLLAPRASSAQHPEISGPYGLPPFAVLSGELLAAQR